MTVMPKNKRDQEVPEDSADRSSWSEDQKAHKYYYDDAHGYEEYDPTKDKDDDASDDDPDPDSKS
jgi:hypothetical protein